MLTISRLRLLVVGLLLLALSPSLAWAQQKAPAGPPQVQVAEGKVAIKLLVVAATDAHEGMDPRLKPLEKHLQFLRYRGYDLVNSHTAELEPEGQHSFSINGGRRVAITLLGKTPERAQFRVEMYNQKGKLLDTTLSVNRNGTFIVAGPRYNDGILILPLQVRY